MNNPIQGWSPASGELFGRGLYLAGNGAHSVERMTDDMTFRLT